MVTPKITIKVVVTEEVSLRMSYLQDTSSVITNAFVTYQRHPPLHFLSGMIEMNYEQSVEIIEDGKYKQRWMKSFKIMKGIMKL